MIVWSSGQGLPLPGEGNERLPHPLGGCSCDFAERLARFLIDESGYVLNPDGSVRPPR